MFEATKSVAIYYSSSRKLIHTGLSMPGEGGSILSSVLDSRGQ